MNKLFSTIMSVCLACNVQATDLFKTSQDIALRAPSVPLITSDTYLAIWSPYNELNEGNTEHWTAATHPLLGALRVDGKVYRFMGKDKENLEVILPMTNDERWDAKYTLSSPIRRCRMEKRESRFRHQRYEVYQHRVEHRRYLGTPQLRPATGLNER